MTHCFLTVLMLLSGPQGWAQGIESKYTKVNDKEKCQYSEHKGSSENPEYCQYICDGPVKGIQTKLLSCSEYEHLFFQVDGKWYSSWNAMTQVGGQSGLGNKKGLVEWVFAAGAAAKQKKPQGLIVRFSGVDDANHNKQALAVFSLDGGPVCWKGNFPDNESARRSLDKKGCHKELSPESDSRK